MTKRQRIAVLGGGIGSLATVFHLTETPGWSDKFEITLYQQGWRLGGKCASGRDMRPQYGARILEHGLHLFAGFYDYSFDMLRRCYEALDRPPNHPNRRVWDAFIGLDAITLMDRIVAPDGSVTFDPWNINFEPAPGVPGDDLGKPSVPQMLLKLIRLLARFSPGIGAMPIAPPTTSPGDFLKRAFDDLSQLIDCATIDLAGGLVRSAIANLEAHSGFLAGIDTPPSKLVERIRMCIYLVQTVVHGILVDEVLTKGFNHLDEFELKDWIRKHGEAVARQYKDEVPDPVAAAAALADSPIVRSGYDYVFGYADGDINRPAQGAGTSLRGFLRLGCGFKGHLFYAMRGGMGDVVIAPLYQVLAARGVKFKFFSRVERLTPGGGGIEALEISEQASAKGGADYSPLIATPVAGWPADAPLPTWPAEPLWDQLENGDALRASGVDFEAPWSPAPSARTLRRGEDFDTVVLGIPLGELKRICADLPAINPAWGRMFATLATTRTIALQMWMRRTNEDLGCDTPGRTLTGDLQPLSCWADMTHLISRETWSGAERPLSIAYFCGQLPGGPVSNDAEAAAATAAAADASRAWLAAQAGNQWPAATAANSFGLDPALLVDPEGRAGEARFLAQYWRANATPSELYVQFVPGSLPARLRANESGFDNLFLCGDWTRNGLNAGAAEAAAMSGAICAKVLNGDLSPIPGEQDVMI